MTKYCPKVRVKMTRFDSKVKVRGNPLLRAPKDNPNTVKLELVPSMDEAGAIIYSWGVHANDHEEMVEWMDYFRVMEG